MLQHLLKRQELQVKNREVHRAFWQLVREGRSSEEAAAVLGVAEETARVWFGNAGGVVPFYASAQPSGRYLTIDERAGAIA